MDCTKSGAVIRALRKEKGLKQYQLAEKLNISEKTVSKWERGLGCPDVSLLSELADVLEVKVENLLTGDLSNGKPNSGNLKNLCFFICPVCGNIITSFSDTAVYCCGRKLDNKTPAKATDAQKLSVEIVENEWYVSSPREMTKENYVTFVAYLTADKITLTKTYPEWDLQTRFYNRGHGKIVWGESSGGIYYQLI